MLDPPAISRRTFIRAATFSAAMVAVSRLRPAAAVAAGEASPGNALRVLSLRDAAILTAIAARITDTGDPSMPHLGETAALSTIDSALLHLDAGARSQFRWALTLFEYGPMLFQLQLRRFTSLGPDDQDAHIAHWRDSRFETRRLVYRAMKNLSFLGYYSQDSTWKGIHYGGPMAPRPRRVVAVS